MIIFPAVDLQSGKAVRLRQGVAEDATVFSTDPVATARRWEEAGASWLHLVDLDGAFEGKAGNADTVKAICKALSIPVQLGGGIRDADSARMWIEAGVERLIIGTMALENRDEFARVCAAYPGKIGASLDAVDGCLKTRGWVKDAKIGINEAYPLLVEAGAAFFVYTDITRDGMHSGINLPMMTRLSRTSPIPVIAAGGLHNLDDVKNLYPLSRTANLQGAISGRALYDGSLDLGEALNWIAAQGG